MDAAPKTTPADVVHRLQAQFGTPAWRPHGDAVAELVLTLLSQNTSDHNSGRAFSRLLQRFPDWQDVVAAPVSEVEEAIRPGGLAPTKAPRLQSMLREVLDRCGSFDLDFLRSLPPDEARAWLRSLPAVGPKTAACVLLFALGMPALPVDTHVHRVASRLGFVPEKTAAEKAQGLLEGLVQAEDQYLFHVMLIRHGRHVCSARSPTCGRCRLFDVCPTGPRLVASGRSRHD